MPKATLLNNNTDFLKIIAIISMTIDHFSKVFFPKILILRAFGRIAFPLFAFCLVLGLINTKNIGKYFLRLLIFAFISQPFYVLAFSLKLLSPNILFTLFLGLVVLWSLKNRKWWLFIPAYIAAGVLKIDYGITGILLMITFYTFLKIPILFYTVSALFLASGFLNAPFINVLGLKAGISGFAVFALPFIAIKPLKIKRLNKYFFYWYYPAHLIVICIIKALVF